jgi:twitching motility protein PilT
MNTSEPQSCERLNKLLSVMESHQATDLHLKVGQPPMFRVETVLRAIKADPLTGDDMQQIIAGMMTEEREESLRTLGNIDLSHSLTGSDRFRINIFRQCGSVSLSARRVTKEIPTCKDLHLPDSVLPLIQADQGLILLSGPTGSGKSTTIAAMINEINRTRRCHIITLEDPIEYLYEDDQSLINQREIGIDVPDFGTALRSMLREDPDVVLIGEMRDPETFEAALQAAETGHLVFGTIHASSAPQTIGRILDLFSESARNSILQTLSISLRAIVCQKLLPCIQDDISRVPAVEVMPNTPVVRKLIEEGRYNELSDVIRSHEGDDMQSFSESLYQLIENEMIEPKVAYQVAPNPEELKMRLKGITQSASGIIGRSM